MRVMRMTVRDKKVDMKKMAILERWYAKKGIKILINYMIVKKV